jgi:hypothetical protein
MNRSTGEVALIIVIAMWIKKTMTHFMEVVFCAFERKKKNCALTFV